MTILPPFAWTPYGMSLAGETRMLEPIMMTRSEAAWMAKPFSKISPTKFSPKLMMVSLSSPLQLGVSQTRPVL